VKIETNLHLKFLVKFNPLILKISEFN